MELLQQPGGGVHLTTAPAEPASWEGCYTSFSGCCCTHQCKLTWTMRFGNFSRSAFTLDIVSGMNFWPPKPGSTVMISTYRQLVRCGTVRQADEGPQLPQFVQPVHQLWQGSVQQMKESVLLELLRQQHHASPCQ